MSASGTVIPVSALDNLGPQFYHGTNVQLGDSVDPRPRLAYATTSLSDARSYGKRKVMQEGGTPRVYRVEPHPDAILYDDSGDGGRGAWSSTKPFKILGEA